MRSNNSNNSAGGMGFTSTLAIVFIALKLCHVIEWSWFWVLSPIWISTILGLIIVIIYAIMLK